jgi:hypothetical protein
MDHRGINTFWFPRNLSNHMDRLASTCDTVAVKITEMTAKHYQDGWEGGKKTTENKVH